MFNWFDMNEELENLFNEDNAVQALSQMIKPFTVISGGKIINHCNCGKRRNRNYHLNWCKSHGHNARTINNIPIVRG